MASQNPKPGVKKETIKDYEPSETVILAVDDSAHSERAFDHYMKKIHRDGNQVMMVHSFESPHLHRGLTIGGFEVVHDTIKDHLKIIEEHRQDAQKLKQKYDEKLKGSNIKYEFHLLETKHQAGPTLCSLAENKRAKMIVLGSRGVGFIRETILGSVSSYVVNHANVPVLVIKRKQDLYSSLFPSNGEDDSRMKWYY